MWREFLRELTNREEEEEKNAFSAFTKFCCRLFYTSAPSQMSVHCSRMRKFSGCRAHWIWVRSQVQVYVFWNTTAAVTLEQFFFLWRKQLLTPGMCGFLKFIFFFHTFAHLIVTERSWQKNWVLMVKIHRDWNNSKTGAHSQGKDKHKTALRAGSGNCANSFFFSKPVCSLISELSSWWGHEFCFCTHLLQSCHFKSWCYGKFILFMHSKWGHTQVIDETPSLWAAGGCWLSLSVGRSQMRACEMLIFSRSWCVHVFFIRRFFFSKAWRTSSKQFVTFLLISVKWCLFKKKQ